MNGVNKETKNNNLERNSLSIDKLSSHILAFCLVLLIGVILLTSGSMLATIHFAYAKKHGSSSSNNCTGNETCPTPTPPPTLKRCERPDSTAKMDLDKNLKTEDCDKGDANEGGTPPPPPPGPTLPDDCKYNSKIVCPPRTIIHNTIVKQSTAGPYEADVFVVTSCTTDLNDGDLKGNLATLCDTAITLMHNEGLASTIPQVDLYLKARGLMT